MKIIQVFRSSADNHVIGQIELGNASSSAPVPVVGDEVRWVANDKVYVGRVSSRLISYSRPDKIGLDRSDEVDVTAELTVNLGEGTP